MNLTFVIKAILKETGLEQSDISKIVLSTLGLKQTAEVYAILEKGQMNAYEIAAQMAWGVTCKKFSEFPAPQKWFS